MKAKPLTIVAVRSTVTGQWNYCPEMAYLHLGWDRLLEYDAESTGHATAEEALDRARADKSIPKGSTFKAIDPKPVQRSPDEIR
jgi:hypothetical protein